MRKFALIAFLFLTYVAGSGVVSPARAQTADINFVLLEVPFVVQAPLGDWSWPWQDFCEEASVVMAYAYAKGLPMDPLTSALEMLKLAVFELKNFGYEKDTTLVETERMMNEHYRYERTRIVENPTVSFIKGEISRGHLVIVPAAGRLLKNPHFAGLGPRYHMVVIRGFDGPDFIVNEPGTKNGKAYRYPMSVIMNAMHDFVPEKNGSILTGRRAVLVVEKP